MIAAVPGGVASVWQRRAAGLRSSEMFDRKEKSMTQENVVVVRFTEPSKAYQALSALSLLIFGG